MNGRIALILILTVFVLFSATCSQAGSIWAKRDKNMKALYADDVARQIGDILTINITEDSKVDKRPKEICKKRQIVQRFLMVK